MQTTTKFSSNFKHLLVHFYSILQDVLQNLSLFSVCMARGQKWENFEKLCPMAYGYRVLLTTSAYTLPPLISHKHATIRLYFLCVSLQIHILK